MVARLCVSRGRAIPHQRRPRWTGCAHSQLSQARNIKACKCRMSEFPNKPICIITALAGSDMDSVAHAVAERISPRLGQPVTVENYGPDLLAGNLLKSPPD